MDKVARTIMTVAVAVLFPVLVYFTANTFLPDKSISTNRYDDRSYCTDDYNPSKPSSCSYRGYSYGVQDNDRGVMRSGLAISLALVGLVVALALRKIKELLVGFVVGGSITIFGAVTYLAGVGDPGTSSVSQFVYWMSAFAFVAMVSILYTADHSLAKPKQDQKSKDKSK